MLDPVNPDFLTDTVIVYPPVVTTDDDAGSIQRDGPGVTMPAAVQAVSDMSEGPHRDILGDVPIGEAYRVLLFAEDPGILDTDQRIEWINHASIQFGSLRVLVAIKKQIDPGGGKTTYRVVCKEIAMRPAFPIPADFTAQGETGQITLAWTGLDA